MQDDRHPPFPLPRNLVLLLLDLPTPLLCWSHGKTQTNRPLSAHELCVFVWYWRGTQMTCEWRDGRRHSLSQTLLRQAPEGNPHGSCHQHAALLAKGAL